MSFLRLIPFIIVQYRKRLEIDYSLMLPIKFNTEKVNSAPFDYCEKAHLSIYVKEYETIMNQIEILLFYNAQSENAGNIASIMRFESKSAYHGADFMRPLNDFGVFV